MIKIVFCFISNGLFIFLLVINFLLANNFLPVNNEYSLNKKTSVVKDDLEKIDLIYYDRFSYKKSYDEMAMPECIRSPISKKQKGSIFLLCREHITLLRPASVIKLWQRQQRLKGYIPFSMKEFGIINVHAYITGVRKYISMTKNNITPDSAHVTGKFIRYTEEVNHYTIKDRQTNAISVINSTPNHPFYVINKHKFIPISRVLTSDSLVTLSSHQAHLMYPEDNHYSFGINSKKNTLVHVYNIEIEKKHIYFIGKLNILVHNPCPVLKAYYTMLKSENIFRHYYSGNNYYMQLEIVRNNLNVLNPEGSALDSRGRMLKEIVRALDLLGFKTLEGSGALTLEDACSIDFSTGNADDILIWRLRKPMSMEEYEGNFLEKISDHEKPLQYREVSSTAKDAVDTTHQAEGSGSPPKKRRKKASGNDERNQSI